MEKAVSGWVCLSDCKPQHNQWVTVWVGDGFRSGQYASNHPFSPAIVDRMVGKFYYGFTHWLPIPTAPDQ